MKFTLLIVAALSALAFADQYCCPSTHKELICNCRLTDTSALLAEHAVTLCDNTIESGKGCSSGHTKNYCCAKTEKADIAPDRWNGTSCVGAKAYKHAC